MIERKRANIRRAAGAAGIIILAALPAAAEYPLPMPELKAAEFNKDLLDFLSAP